MSHLKEFEHLKITLKAIKSATNNFSLENLIGRGGFGNVYKGEIAHFKGQSMVAFKRLDCAFGQGNPEFWKEITMLTLYKHENLVQLLGFCDESEEKILVYDYAAKKSLDLYLSSNDLTWTQRLKICIGAARGLEYLHCAETQARVLHRDIKSSNILLDENWNAKISDFGLSKVAHANKFTFFFTSVVGTCGYCDPLYMETGLLTKESDVYSLGVVLFEILCGRLCISHRGDQPLTRLARECYEQNKVNTIIFGNIRDEISPSSLKTYTTIAYQCLKIDREERPSITDVVRMLETALRYQDPMEEYTGASHFEKIIALSLHYRKSQKDNQIPQQLQQPHESHALALSQVCPNNLNDGPVLLPLDLCGPQLSLDFPPDEVPHSDTISAMEPFLAPLIEVELADNSDWSKFFDYPTFPPCVS